MTAHNDHIDPDIFDSEFPDTPDSGLPDPAIDSDGPAIAWETFTRRTNDPKLSYLEWRLDCIGVKHRRNGESFHAPILEVEARNIDAAWEVLNEKVGDCDLDDIEDDDPMFANWTRPEHDDSGVNEEAEWLAELERGYAQDRI